MNRNHPLIQFCDLFMGKRKFGLKGIIIIVVITAAVMILGVIGAVYGQFAPGQSAYDTIMNATKNGTSPIVDENETESESELTAYGQDDPVYSSPGIEGLRGAIDKHACEMAAMENENGTLLGNATSIDRMDCIMGDLLK